MFHVKHEGWGTAGPLGEALDETARSRMELFEQMLLDRAIPWGMIAKSDAPRVRERHLLDSLRAVPLLPASGTMCDLGSGAGLPGVVLSIARPDLGSVLIEVRRHRAAFLQEVIVALELENVEVFARRLETFRQEIDVCTARALGSPASSWTAAERLLTPTGCLIYWAGTTFDAQRDVPDSVTARLFTTVGLARSGPLVIMTR